MMDADILRLILIALGVVVVVVVYLWERRKRIQPGGRPIHFDQLDQRLEPTLGKEPALEEDEARAEPTLPGFSAEPGEAHSDDPAAQPAQAPESPDPDTAEPVTARGGPPSDSRTTEAAGKQVPVDPAGDADLPRLLLQINVVSKAGVFEGPAIQRALEEVGMLIGDMRIYHRCDGDRRDGPVLFSLASMVEPGIFPLDDMHAFKTPGLSMFAQLPGPQDGLAIFADMLFSAERIAAELDGELQDDTHSRLTKQTMEHIRGQILEHGRRVQLARSKRA